MSFHYHEIAPQTALAPYINCFWWMEETGLSTITDRSVPDGCMELLFHMRNRVERTTVDGQTQLNPRVELIGQQIQPYTIRMRGENQVLGVRFFPHTFSFFSQVPLLYFTNQVLDATLVLEAGFCDIARQVLDADCRETAIGRLEAHFMQKIVACQSDARHRFANFAVQWMLRSEPTNHLDLLIRQTGVTPRYLQQIFEQRVGISPKLL